MFIYTNAIGIKQPKENERKEREKKDIYTHISINHQASTGIPNVMGVMLLNPPLHRDPMQALMLFLLADAKPTVPRFNR